jgi:hypothetical protein
LKISLLLYLRYTYIANAIENEIRINKAITIDTKIYSLPGLECSSSAKINVKSSFAINNNNNNNNNDNNKIKIIIIIKTLNR